MMDTMADRCRTAEDSEWKRSFNLINDDYIFIDLQRFRADAGDI